MITVFTPTYNRAYILPKLYESLCNQTCKDFEWLVVDDGSTDETPALLQKWQAEKKIAMNIISRKNGGKSTAINLGIQNANGNLFFIVDSDDFLTDNAIEVISAAEKEREKTGWQCTRLCRILYQLFSRDRFRYLFADALIRLTSHTSPGIFLRKHARRNLLPSRGQ